MLPHARDNPPWSCNGSTRAADFGNLYAEQLWNGGWSFTYDRAGSAFAFSTSKPELGAQVEHNGVRWDVVRLDAKQEIAA